MKTKSDDGGQALGSLSGQSPDLTALRMIPISEWAHCLGINERKLRRWIVEVAAILNGPELLGGCLTRVQLDEFLKLKEELSRRRRKARRGGKARR